ncbi:hypothetical protein Tco_1508965, partial [Tanacetum coccineum]
DLKQTKQIYGATYTKLIRKVKQLEKTVKSSQARRKTRIVVSNDEANLEDSSKQGRKIAKINQDPDISLLLLLVLQAKMDESETVQTKTKLQQEQERLGYEAAMRLQAELDKEERQKITRVHESTSSFNVEEWDDIQARVEADEELAQRFQVEEREKYTKAEQARMLVELIN